jgi:hypothetical protein
VWLFGGVALLLLVALLAVVSLISRSGGPGGDVRDPAGDQRPTPAGSQPAAPVPSAAVSPSPLSVPPDGVAPASPAPDTEPSGQTGQVVPAGWRLHRDRSGFSVPVPKGWNVSRQGSIVYFREANGRRWFLIDQTDTPRPDPVADWRSKEPHRRDTVSGYERVGEIRAVDYYLKAADWEWRYNDGGRRHTRNRGFIAARDKAYAIRWDTLASEWDKNLVNFNIIADGFRPVRR